MLYGHKKATALFHLVQCASPKKSLNLKLIDDLVSSGTYFWLKDTQMFSHYTNYWHMYNIMLGDHRKKSRRVKQQEAEKRVPEYGGAAHGP